MTATEPSASNTSAAAGPAVVTGTSGRASRRVCSSRCRAGVRGPPARPSLRCSGRAPAAHGRGDQLTPMRRRTTGSVDHLGGAAHDDAPAAVRLVVDVVDLEGDDGLRRVDAEHAARLGADDHGVVDHGVVDRDHVGAVRATSRPSGRTRPRGAARGSRHGTAGWTGARQPPLVDAPALCVLGGEVSIVAPSDSAGQGPTSRVVRDTDEGGGRRNVSHRPRGPQDVTTRLGCVDVLAGSTYGAISRQALSRLGSLDRR